MSDKETKKKPAGKKNAQVQEASGTQDKFMTSYDRKMQRRQEEREREEKEKRIGMAVGAVIVAAIAVLALSFPVRRYIVTHGAYVTVGGEDITKPEFDYHYNLVVSNYISQYGSYLNYFGLDTTKDFSSQIYSGELSWQDYFEEMTVDNLVQVKALKAAAEKDGFTCDVSGEIADFEKGIKESASGAELSVGDYVRQLYGNYATLQKVSAYMEEGLKATQYYDKVAGEKAASDAEIQAYYEENKADYDSVDYYQTIVKAQMPTEPTELADPVEETANGETAADGTEEKAYQPSEAEIAKAMEDAKKQADLTDAKDGERMENMQSGSVSYLIRDWLFDEARKENDTTVIEDKSGNQYYVLAFAERYLDHSPTADVRVIFTEDTDGQAILDEWKAGAATEERFKELYAKYSLDAAYSTNEGLMKGVTKSGLEDSLAEWIFAEERAAGDTTSILSASGYTYVIYYAGEGDPEWKNRIADTLLEETMEAYMDEISENIPVEDKHDRLKYLKVRAAEEAAAGSGETEQN